MSIADKIGRLTTARNNIRAALIDKDVAAGSHGFEAFASDIAAISGGTVATATKTVTGAANTTISFSVQGPPKMFAVIAAAPSSTNLQVYAAIWDGSAVYAQILNFGEASYKTGFTQTYNDGTLQISTGGVGEGIWARNVEYKLVYVY